MRRVITNTAVALCISGLTGAARAQQPTPDLGPLHSPSRFDLSVYAGGSWTTPWLEAEGTEFSIGLNPIFGTSAAAWLTPHFGIRLHGAYLASDIPRADELDSLRTDGRPLNAWFYDLELTARPFATSPGASRQLASLYFWLGGGGLTVNPAGNGSPTEAGCVYPYSLGDACLSYSGKVGTVGQATAGTGMSLFRIAGNLGVYGELGVHAYDSPFHVGRQWVGGGEAPPCRTCIADDGMALTTRFVLGARLMTGRSASVVPAVVPMPPPPAPPPPPPPPPPPERPIELCVVEAGIPQYVEAIVLPEDGDTVVVESGIRRPVFAVYPTLATTAAGEDWFVNNEDIVLMGRPYVKFGVPRSVRPEELVRVGEFGGIPVFRAADEGGTPVPTVYVPAEDGCLFQPYQIGDRVRRVRG